MTQDPNSQQFHPTTTFSKKRHAVGVINHTVLQVGSRVRMTGYSPFRGLKGTVQIVDANLGPGDSFCFYLVNLEGAHIKEPMWFQCEEVELVSPNLFVDQI